MPPKTSSPQRGTVKPGAVLIQESKTSSRKHRMASNARHESKCWTISTLSISPRQPTYRLGETKENDKGKKGMLSSFYDPRSGNRKNAVAMNVDGNANLCKISASCDVVFPNRHD